MTNALNNIGLVHKRNDNPELALEYYHRVKHIRTLRNDQRGINTKYEYKIVQKEWNYFFFR